MPQNKSFYSISPSGSNATSSAAGTTPTQAKIEPKSASKAGSVLFSRPASLTSQNTKFQRNAEVLKPKAAFGNVLSPGRATSPHPPASTPEAKQPAAKTPASDPTKSQRAAPTDVAPMLFATAMDSFGRPGQHVEAAAAEGATSMPDVHPASFAQPAGAQSAAEQLADDAAEPNDQTEAPILRYEGPLGETFDMSRRARGLASSIPPLRFKPTSKVVAHGASEVTAYLQSLPARFQGNVSNGRCSMAEAAAAGATDKRTAEIKQLLDSASSGEQRSETEQQACVLAEGFLAAACLSTKRVLAQVFTAATADLQKAAQERMKTCCAQVSMLQVCPGAGDDLVIHHMVAVDPSDAMERGGSSAEGGEARDEAGSSDDSQ